MKKLITSVLFLFAVISFSQAQQDPMFTKYAFNALSYNPAYAGSREHLSMGLLHRTQWWGIQGAPHSQTFWIHTPLKYDRIALGFHLTNDIIGPTNSISANIDYAYRIKVGEKSNLSVGLQGGLMNWRADWSKLTYESQGDEAYSEENPSFWLPNFGVGLYFQHPNFFAGVSAPHLIEHDLRNDSNGDPVTTEMYAKQYRHYYFTAGAAIPLDKSANFVFRPILLVKNVGLLSNLKKEDNPFNNVGAPTEFDIDLSVLMYDALWLGVSFRSAFEAFNDLSSYDSGDVWLNYRFNNGLSIGAAYDYTFTKLQTPAQGSFEVMLGYDFNYDVKTIVTPRYF